VVPVAGVDGCGGGWVVVSDAHAFVCERFRDVLAGLPDDTVIGVDIPIGLPDTFLAGGRRADREAREVLGWPRRNSVFSAPPRVAFGARTPAQARASGCRMTLQALKIMPKVAEVDDVMTPELQARVFEVHPEVSFWAMNHCRAMRDSKRTKRGREERRGVLARASEVIPARPYAGEQEDDVLDGCAALWSARRLARSEGQRVPVSPPLDSRQLRMEICW
jgi:predicted RNase H-like nuclease